MLLREYNQPWSGSQCNFTTAFNGHTAVGFADIFLILSNWSQKYEFTAAPALEEDVASAENDAAANRAEMLGNSLSLHHRAQ